MTDISHIQRSPFTHLTAAWSAIPWLYRVLWMLAGLRVLVALLIMLDVLPMPPDMRFGWHLHHGGDQDIMFGLARSIIEGHPTPVVVGLGQSLVMLPLILLFQPYYYTDIVVPLVILNGFLLAGLSVVMLGSIAKHVTGSDRTAAAAAALWAAAPLIAYVGFFWHPEALTLRGTYVPVFGWLNGLSDGPAMFLMLLAVMLLAQELRAAEPPTLKKMLLFGVVLGAMITFRIHTLPVALFLLFYVFVVSGWRKLLVTVLGGLLAYIPQAWYNTVVFRLPFTTGYLSIYQYQQGPDSQRIRPLSEVIPSVPLHPKFLLELANLYFGDRPWLLVIGVIGLAASVGIAVMLWKQQGWRLAALLVGAPLAYLLAMMATEPFRLDPLRFSMPAMPFAIAFGIYGLSLIGRRWRAGTDPRAGTEPETPA